MKRDGRTLAHNTLEEIRVLAVQRMKDGEHPEVFAAQAGKEIARISGAHPAASIEQWITRTVKG
jgi:thioredoxin-like negative regulator of GroEL